MTQPDELIDFHHLKSRRGLTQLELEDEVATDLQKADRPRRTAPPPTPAASTASCSSPVRLPLQKRQAAKLLNSRNMGVCVVVLNHKLHLATPARSQCRRTKPSPPQAGDFPASPAFRFRLAFV